MTSTRQQQRNGMPDSRSPPWCSWPPRCEVRVRRILLGSPEVPTPVPQPNIKLSRAGVNSVIHGWEIGSHAVVMCSSRIDAKAQSSGMCPSSAISCMGPKLMAAPSFLTLHSSSFSQLASFDRGTLGGHFFVAATQGPAELRLAIPRGFY